LRALVQRVRRASVAVDGREVAAIGPGLLVLLGVARDDAEAHADKLADKVGALRVFDDDAGRMSEPLGDREALCVSQFTLYADTRKGRRPSWQDAATGDVAEPLVDTVVEELRARGCTVATGVFGARMQVSSVNEGPMTLLLET
jgi:D-tyrosyl-tRNA(Tyr) deacylase